MDFENEFVRNSHSEDGSADTKKATGPNREGKSAPEFNFKQMDDKSIKEMVFVSVDEAHKFYKEYGRHMGHDVRITHTKFVDKIETNSETDRSIVKKIAINREMECVWAGCPRTPSAGGKRELVAETRCNCPAEMRVARRGNLFVVTDFCSSHNHELATPETAHLLKVNRFISDADKTLLSLFNESGFRTCHSVDYLERVNGGNLSFQRKDAYNFLYKERQELVSEGDAQTTFHLLDGMKLLDPEMYYKYEVREDNSLGMLFWADGFSREAYRLFGDVLVFDSTYKTNQYNFPLVIFSGVDNHLKNCVFGAALTFNETIESYRWLLQKFLEAMGGKAPVSVLTDQDASMSAAIGSEFPYAKHRLCSWHLERNCTQKVKRHGFCGDFGQLLKKNLSVEDFETQWEELIGSHGVGGHEWITHIYGKKEQWAEAFFRGHFMGLMRTTQRAESLNSMFKHNVKSGYKITEIIKHFQRILGKIRTSYFQVQEDSEVYKPRLKQSALHSLLKHASSLYTKAVFRLVQDEMREEQGLVRDRSFSTGERQFYYSFGQYGKIGGKRWSVEIDLDRNKFLCDCQMLESDGLPCRHLFSAFKCMQLQEIPCSVVCDRWTTRIGKDLRSRFVNIYPVEDPQRMRFTRVYQEFLNLCMHASSTELNTTRCIKKLRQLSTEFEEEESPVGDLSEMAEEIDDMINPPETHSVRDPQKVKSRGAPPNRKQKCGTCGVEGHKSGGCPKRKGSEPVTVTKTTRKRAKKGVSSCLDTLDTQGSENGDGLM